MTVGTTQAGQNGGASFPPPPAPGAQSSFCKSRKTSRPDRRSLYRSAIGVRRKRQMRRQNERSFCEAAKQSNPTGGASIPPPTALRKPKK
jgi:hypothetical protein